MKILIIVITILIVPAYVLACGMAWPPQDNPAMMNAERTLIIWNAKKKREDFIRSVDFKTESKDLGFIVPVPSIPEVADVKEDVFKALDKEMERQRPVVIVDPESDGTLGGGPSGGMRVAQSVEVVASFELAEYDVKVLKADSIEPLSQWLQENKFFLRPALEKWLQPYIDKKYYFTVFKFRKSGDKSGITSKAIRISFDTETPFYPYRDSEDIVTSKNRHLLLYFLSDAPYAPDFLSEDSQLPIPERWLSPGCRPIAMTTTNLAKDSIDPLFSNRIQRLKELNVSRRLNWLTVWEDKTEKRPDNDITFVESKRLKEPVLLCPR